MKYIYSFDNIPVFQNKVYDSIDLSKKAILGNIRIVQENNSGLIFNEAFDESLMVYDSNYQNEQSYSPFFDNYLKSIADRLMAYDLEGKKIVEIGCGKGYFLEILKERGLDIIGFDPTYEGDKPYIIKEYFGDNDIINADFIILRHTMEHIPDPFSFIHKIAKANSYQGKIFIEVPTFEWINKKNAFWDIFYEHCNYFTENSFSSFFKKSETEKLFSGQYMSIVANLSDLRIKPLNTSKDNFDIINPFNQAIDHWSNFLKSHKGSVIWGAGAKGSTFLNILDRNQEYIAYVVDMNPAKQGKFIASTAHRIVAPEHCLRSLPEQVLVMNENYLDEIVSIVNNQSVQFYCI